MCVRWKYLRYILNIHTCIYAFLLRFVVVGCQPFAEGSRPTLLCLSSWCADNFADPSVMTLNWSMTKLMVLSINSEAPIHTSRRRCSIQRFKWVYRGFDRCCVGSWVRVNSLGPCFVAREDPSVQMWGFVGFWVPCWHSGIILDLSPSLIECHTHIWCEGMFVLIWFFEGKCCFDGQPLNGHPVGTVDTVCTPSR